ncbi:MAG: thiamine kinase-like enzyme [Gammaproteobacteria bacterium]
MNSETIELLENSFKRIPELSAYTIDDFDINQLSGYTNLNFHLKNTKHDWVLRIPKDKTNGYIDRAVEAHNANIAFNLGLAPKCLWRDGSGYSLSNTIRQSRSSEVADLNNPERLGQLVVALQQLHQSNQAFQGTVDISQLLTRYYQLMPKSKRQLLADSYHDATTKVKNVLQQVHRLVPSHNDLVLENILFDSHSNTHRVWIIDWEYATMGSPYWDLATLCNQGKFTTIQAENLLSLYHNKDQALDSKTLSDYRDILNALSVFWMAALAG